ncbi:uncharacterized protein LOC143860840 [Tasmannia lanceolata]|uniref:uncharacterized protein LOC143860840 n=1 Tax=Tasmannia lanceolata TaxID=3420 RepID=UPI00406370FF
MECNRDEAVRAKDIAERKFMAKDIANAKKFALKAHNLFPGLEGISQMLATLDVYLSAENKINGETDWYAVLDVHATADDEMVKKQYRKLALMLHPDKNKSIGADGAFKLLSEAWSVLSDKGRRLAYDQKRNVKGFVHKVAQPSREPSAPNANGFYNFAKSTSSKAKNMRSTGPAPPRPVKPNTFWTACHRCKMQYEYLRVYLNHNLLCPHCHEPFLATETGSPANGSNASAPWSFSQQNVNNKAATKNAYAPGRNTTTVPNTGTTGYPHGVPHDSFNQSNVNLGPFSKTSAQAANVAHHAYEKVRKESEEAQAAARREEHIRRKNHGSKKTSTFAGNSNVGSSSSVPDRENPISKVERPAKKRRGIDDGTGNNYRGNEGEQNVMGNGRAGIGTTQGSRPPTINKCFNDMERANGVGSTMKQSSGIARDWSHFEIRNMLMERARMEIRKKLNEWKSAAISRDMEKGKRKEATVNVDAYERNKSDLPMSDKKQILSKKPSSGVSVAGNDKEAPEPLSISVPDPDFHDFDKDRSERSFQPNQVWAAYDDDDGMPRYYALIHKVVSLKPFKMRFSWLNSKNNSELGPLNWVASGFTKTCGEFRVGRHEACDTVNVFSHRVKWEKGVRGVVRIIPRKGDVWALFRNWSPDWTEITPDEVIHKYDMVEVLDDYNEEQGVSVTPLVKVAGFKTVFHRHMDPNEVKKIPKAEMFRFSHQVPSWLLTGDEGPNAPMGCRELDPAASPLELLQVIIESKDVVVETSVQQPEDVVVETRVQQANDEVVNTGKQLPAS